ncbi:unnamed protein product [Psylliodes chrysocephalus]|uniref:ZP domain-containing protein n=1 Tax=Psylliodes chrysocephalus TaxID=3402493 RepID=A0A9P0GER0_9CUCU|nr:unnamed protein product [Psylliodes chrysocephala]
MKIPYGIVFILSICLLAVGILGEQKGKSKRDKKASTRTSRQLNSNNNADQMVQNILRWLQDVYGSQGRRIRQGSLREYLPPTPGEKPRPFTSRPSTEGAGIDEEGNFVDTGYPPAGITPQPPFTIITNPATGGITGIGSSGIPGEETTGSGGTYYPTQSSRRPSYTPTPYPERPGYSTTGITERPSYPSYETPGPEEPEGTPGQTIGTPEVTPGYPSGGSGGETQGYPTSSPSGFTGYPSGRPTEPSYAPSRETGYPTYPTSSPSGFTGYPSGAPPGATGFPTRFPTARPTFGGEYTEPAEGEFPTSPSAEGYPSSRPTGYPTGPPTGYPSGRPSTGLPSTEIEYTSAPGFPTSRPTGYPTGTPGYPTGTPSFPTSRPTGYPTGTPGFPTARPTGYPTGTPGFPTVPPTGYPTGTPGFPTPRPTGYPTGTPSFPTARPTGFPTRTPSFPTSRPTGFPTAGPSEEPGYPAAGPSEEPGYPAAGPSEEPGYPSGYPTGRPTGYPTAKPTPGSYPTGPTGGSSTEEIPDETGTSAENVPEFPTARPPGRISTEQPAKEPTEGLHGFPTAIPTGIPGEESEPIEPSEGTGKTVPPPTDDLKHPPHIHALDVQCAKDMMTINIEFNRPFDGVIYSKGYYNMPECRYVNENSGQTKYTFTVNLNMCGTQFVNAFDTEGQSYLENILVLQNELGIQEEWDTVRSVRCLWEGNLKEQLSVTLMVGMLSQEIVTFSGDTAMAKLDVLLGRGPFGQPASGLVKIGEPMTLVVSVSGDPGFDVQVKDCRATDSSGINVVPLTDDDGCILKPKLFGSFQKTRNTGDTGASIIAYAYFNAFKFPDVMDIMIECNIELCKTDCEMCSEPNPQLEPGRRRRRDVYGQNETLHDTLTMAKHLRVILPEDLASAALLINEGVCMSTQSFVFASSVLMSLLTASSLISAYFWFKTQKLRSK